DGGFYTYEGSFEPLGARILAELRAVACDYCAVRSDDPLPSKKRREYVVVRNSDGSFELDRVVYRPMPDPKLHGSPYAGSESEPSAAGDVEASLRQFSDALAKGDASALTSLTGGFLTLIEDGRTYNLPQTIASAQAALRTGSMTRTLQAIGIQTRGSVAWADYRVVGEFRGGKTA